MEENNKEKIKVGTLKIEGVPQSILENMEKAMRVTGLDPQVFMQHLMEIYHDRVIDQMLEDHEDKPIMAHTFKLEVTMELFSDGDLDGLDGMFDKIFPPSTPPPVVPKTYEQMIEERKATMKAAEKMMEDGIEAAKQLMIEAEKDIEILEQMRAEEQAGDKPKDGGRH